MDIDGDLLTRAEFVRNRPCPKQWIDMTNDIRARVEEEQKALKRRCLAHLGASSSFGSSSSSSTLMSPPLSPVSAQDDDDAASAEPSSPAAGSAPQLVRHVAHRRPQLARRVVMVTRAYTLSVPMNPHPMAWLAPAAGADERTVAERTTWRTEGLRRKIFDFVYPRELRAGSKVMVIHSRAQPHLAGWTFRIWHIQKREREHPPPAKDDVCVTARSAGFDPVCETSPLSAPACKAPSICSLSRSPALSHTHTHARLPACLSLSLHPCAQSGYPWSSLSLFYESSGDLLRAVPDKEGVRDRWAEARGRESPVPP